VINDQLVKPLVNSAYLETSHDAISTNRVQVFCVNNKHCFHRILYFKATMHQIFDIGWGSAPDFAGGASALPQIAGFYGSYSLTFQGKGQSRGKGRGMYKERQKEKRGERSGKERGYKRKRGFLFLATPLHTQWCMSVNGANSWMTTWPAANESASMRRLQRPYCYYTLHASFDTRKLRSSHQTDSSKQRYSSSSSPCELVAASLMRLIVGLLWGRWKRETGKRGTGKPGTKSQGWKTRDRKTGNLKVMESRRCRKCAT